MKKSSLLAGALAAAVICAPPALTTATAGNQHGPGWQQAKAKKKKGAAPEETGKAPRAKVVPESGGPADPPEGMSARAVPAEETLLRSLPGSGSVSEDELILLAISNNTKLTRLRNEVAISQAKKLGAGDLKNPELRIGYAWDYDERLRDPFTELSTETINSRESYLQTQSTRNLAPSGEVGNGESQSEVINGRENRTRYRTIERTVTPGRYRDVTTTKVYERDISRRDTRENRTGVDSVGPLPPRNQATSRTQDGRLVEESREITNHPDDYSKDEQLSILIRFSLPHPWERKAKIEVAAAEIARAEADYLGEEDKVILTVRELYEELTTLEGRLGATDARRRSNESYKADIEKMADPNLADLAADVRLDISKNGLDSRELRTDIARVREELAVMCGLDDPERIRVSNKAARRSVDVSSLDVDYLTGIALLHRSDLLDLQARHKLAIASLKEVKALRIPFFTFMDAGWSTTTTSQRSGDSQEWQVRAGISLPLFDWTGINKAHKEFETAGDLYNKQIEEERRLIEVEIRQAINRIRAADKELGVFDKEIAQHKSYAEISERESAADPARRLRTKQKGDDLTARFEENRYELWSDYSKAVLELERALGTRLDKALSGRVTAGK